MPDEIEQQPQEQQVEPEAIQPETEVIKFDPAIAVGPNSPGQPLETVAEVEYRGNDGNHIIRLPDGRVVAVAVVSGDKVEDIRAGLS